MPRSSRTYLAIATVALSLGASPMVLNAVVDPFDMNRLVDLGLEKRKYAEKRHGQLAKIIGYPNRRSPYVVFGDSRSRALREKLFRESRFGQDVFNFAYSGGTVPEMIDSFWYAARTSDLKGVVFSVPLRMFTRAYKDGKNMVPEAVAMASSPLSYYTNMDVAEAGYDILKRNLKRESTALNEAVTLIGGILEHVIKDAYSAPLKLIQRQGPPKPRPQVTEENGLEEPASMPSGPLFELDRVPYALTKPVTGKGRDAVPAAASRKSKWRKQLVSSARSDWEEFSYATDYVDDLKKVIEYSRQNGIKVVLFIPPTPIEMQQRLLDFGRSELAITHLRTMASLAPVLDFDFPNEITADPRQFSDALHFKAKVAREMAHEIVRQFDPPAASEAWIQKRRRRLHCPAATSADQDFVSLPGVLSGKLGKACIVWHHPA